MPFDAPSPFPYQHDGIDFLAETPKAMLADEPGLGKTCQAILALKQREVRGPVTVLCPRSAIFNWRWEFKKWWPDCPNRIHITNYEQVSLPGGNSLDWLTEEWDAFLLDEAHRLMNPAARRTQVIYRKARTVPVVWPLTGTPAPNHAGELWTHLRVLRPGLLKNASGRPMEKDQFEAHFCNMKENQYGGMKPFGSKNIPELRQMLFGSGFMLRRLKKHVLPQLPPLRFEVRPVPATKRLDAETMRAIFNGSKGSEKIMNLFLAGDGDVDLEELEAALLPISSELRALGVIKADAICEWVADEMENPGKVLIIYKHRVVGDLLQQQLGAFCPARVDGQTRDSEKQVGAFQEDDTCRVFLGQIDACQEAITLTKARMCIMAEASWVPKDNVQAACRGHRIGMLEGYQVFFACLPGTLDMALQRVHVRKSEELAQIFDEGRPAPASVRGTTHNDQSEIDMF